MSAATTASSSKILFAPASRTSIALPAHAQSVTNRKRSSKETNDLADKYKRKRREKERQKEESANLLPDDMHFSSRQLVRLFMKPKFAVSLVVILIPDIANALASDAEEEPKCAD
jgi:condensin complex subunit 2